MQRIKLMTDSACDLPGSLARQLGIEVIPIPIAVDGKGYVSFDFRYDTAWENSNQRYIVDSSYEEAYYYTTQSGCEFLITADSGHVWAECCTAHANVSLSGAYLTTDAVEQIVEHLALSIKE